MLKPVQTQSPQVNQQGQAQQPLTQIEQMQNMFQQQLEQKSSQGPLLTDFSSFQNRVFLEKLKIIV